MHGALPFNIPFVVWWLDTGQLYLTCTFFSYWLSDS